MPLSRIIPIPSVSHWISIMSIGILSCTLFFSAIGVIYNKHVCRQLFTQLQRLQQDVEALQVEWSQLLLEQGTWANGARVERLSQERLQMRLPEPNEVVVIVE